MMLTKQLLSSVFLPSPLIIIDEVDKTIDDGESRRDVARKPSDMIVFAQSAELTLHFELAFISSPPPQNRPIRSNPSSESGNGQRYNDKRIGHAQVRKRYRNRVWIAATTYKVHSVLRPTAAPSNRLELLPLQRMKWVGDSEPAAINTLAMCSLHPCLSS